MTILLRVLHIGIAAAWFGHKLLIPGEIKTGLDSQDAAVRLVQRLDRAQRLGQFTGVGTLVTGGLLWWNVGTVDTGVMIGTVLVVAAILLGATVARPASNALNAAVEAGNLDAARLAGRRIMGVLAIESLIWVGALVSMIA